MEDKEKLVVEKLEIIDLRMFDALMCLTKSLLRTSGLLCFHKKENNARERGGGTFWCHPIGGSVVQ